MMANKTRETEPTDDFKEKNDAAQSMTVPRTPRLTADISDLATDRELPGEINVLDLPDDVKKNIVGYENMELDQLILKSLNLFTVPIIVDRLVIVLWQVHKYQADRMRILKRLRNLAKEGFVVKVEGTNGTYHLTDAGKALPGVST